MKSIFFIVLILIVSASVFAQTAVEPTIFEGKYQIACLENLYWIAAPDSVVPIPDTATRWSSHYVQLNDINAAPTHSWFPDGSGGYYGWEPIGYLSVFSGTYNGRGFGIDSLYANRNTAGLFDVISGSHVNISGIKLTNISITSTNYAGGIASQSLYRSVIENCSVSGSIFGNFKVGGITGYSDTSSISWCSVSGSVSGGILVGGITGEITNSTGDTGSPIYNCYSTAAVSGDSRVGGLVAQIGILSLITNSYSSGAVSCSDSYVGGLAWSNMYIVTDSFWDVESSGQTSSAGGTGKTTAEMKTESTFTNAGWSFDYYWEIDPALNDGYPILKWEKRAGYFGGGLGDDGEPYIISNLSHLEFLSSNPDFWSYSYLQTADIDASATSTWNSGAGWSPIGNETITFTGSYNGNRYSINNLYISRNTDDHQALFGYLQGATITNIDLKSHQISGLHYVGGIAGESENSTISNSYTNGSVQGYEAIGGMVGICSESSIIKCTSSGSVSGEFYAGGLIGVSSSSSSVTDCYSFSTVLYDYYGDYIGGLIGGNYSSEVNRCYSAGEVTGNNFTGGLIGESNFSTTIASFWDTESSTQLISAGGTGKTTAEMKSGTTYASSGWDFEEGPWAIDTVNNGGYPWLKWQGFPLQGPAAPENVSIMYDQSGVYVSWLPVAGAMTYNIYYSYDPYAAFPEGWTFADTTGGNFEEAILWIDYDNESSNKKFYVVVAAN